MLTRVEVEQDTVSRTRPALELAGMSTADDGTNTDLNSLMARVLGYFGVRPVTWSSVSDDDLAKIDDDLQGRFLDLLEIAVLYRAWQKLVFSPQKLAWKNFQGDMGNAAANARAYLDEARERFRVAYLTQGAARSGRLRRANRHVMRTGHFFLGRCGDGRFLADYGL